MYNIRDDISHFMTKEVSRLISHTESESEAKKFIFNMVFRHFLNRTSNVMSITKINIRNNAKE